MSDSTIKLSVDQRGVATLTLNRSEKHNAFDDRVIEALNSTLTRIAAEEWIKVMILSSTGNSFSAGADLNWMQRMAAYSESENLEDARRLADMLRNLNTLPQPTIARVQGAAFGGAVGLVSCCDMAVGSTLARFCLSEVRIGLVPATISPYVIAAIGARAARRYFTTAEVMDASTALRLGLLSEVVGVDELDGAVDAIVETLLANGPRAIRAAKSLVSDYAGRAIDDELIEDSCRRIADIRVSEEGQAGLQAFLDRAEPPWRAAGV